MHRRNLTWPIGGCAFFRHFLLDVVREILLTIVEDGALLVVLCIHIDELIFDDLDRLHRADAVGSLCLVDLTWPSSFIRYLTFALRLTNMLTYVGLAATTLTLQMKNGDLADLIPGLCLETLCIATVRLDAATSPTLEAIQDG